MVKHDYQVPTHSTYGKPITMSMQSSVAEVAEGFMWIMKYEKIYKVKIK